MQFTPDLLPSDLVGTQCLRPAGEWSSKKGPVFANFVLADEINRAPAKVQSALLEAMQERQVTSAARRSAARSVPRARDAEPVEQEGTYPLPEAQVDRFMLKLVVGYPTRDEEIEIIDRMAQSARPPKVEAAAASSDLRALRDLVPTVFLDDKVKRFIVDLVFATREPRSVGLEELESLILYGASPRASIALTRCARARAFLQGRGYVTPQDVKAVAMPVLRHRVRPTYEAEAEELTSEDLLAEDPRSRAGAVIVRCATMEKPAVDRPELLAKCAGMQIRTRSPRHRRGCGWLQLERVPRLGHRVRRSA
jgi:MoxR-like ATPase